MNPNLEFSNWQSHFSRFLIFGIVCIERRHKRNEEGGRGGICFYPDSAAALIRVRHVLNYVSLRCCANLKSAAKLMVCVTFTSQSHLSF